MVHQTKGIVLRTVKYGETSIICSVFTELLGLQSYMVKGVRSAKARSRKANPLFSSSILDMVVYHQPLKNLQMIKEYQPAVLYQTIHEDVIKNGVALFAIEMVTQLLAAHDPQPELFTFTEQFLLSLDAGAHHEIANFPLYFLIQSGRISGYHISGHYSDLTPFSDVHEGRFSKSMSYFPPFIEGNDAALMSVLNDANSLESISAINMSGAERKRMLQHFLAFLQLHVPHFRELKSLPILSAILYQ
jgi:DNA repair protein RecO (recombination protein O)